MKQITPAVSGLTYRREYFILYKSNVEEWENRGIKVFPKYGTHTGMFETKIFLKIQYSVILFFGTFFDLSHFRLNRIQETSIFRLIPHSAMSIMVFIFSKLLNTLPRTYIFSYLKLEWHKAHFYANLKTLSNFLY